MKTKSAAAPIFDQDAEAAHAELPRGMDDPLKGHPLPPDAPSPLAITPAPFADPMLQLLSRAVERGFDADQLQQLANIQRALKSDHATETYAMAMNACQREMATVVRDRKNDNTGKKYAQLETVQRSIRPVYTKHGFALSFGTDASPQEKCIRVICDVHHEGGKTQRYFGDFPLDDVGIKGTINKTGIQATGSTMSYARRYLTLLIFNVTVADEDDDGAGAKLTGEQVKEINTLIEDIRNAGIDFNMAGFLAWLGVENLADVLQSKFKAVVHELKRKRGTAK